MPSEERAAWLAENCGDEDLRGQVMTLLEADTVAGNFFDESPELETVPRMQHGDSLAGTTVGGFQLIRLIARGGMGSVYEAEQIEPRRRVAFKTLHRVYDDDWRRRFRLEAFKAQAY